ncbi:hypothetical protein EDE08_117145 [Bradyrhizobium sp. R2.2-H]|jgi:hypothetical protein|nr:hypothetical protein EDE10_1172 [Bradyrhizobium sp. Y-H1]TCU65961.1 hypothetical protein EDE08_117145 [Bradyrhizobium sp. R2.2-H]
MSAPPRSSDVDLLCYCERIVDFNSQVPNSTLHLGVPQKELHGSQVGTLAPNVRCAPSAMSALSASTTTSSSGGLSITPRNADFARKRAYVGGGGASQKRVPQRESDYSSKIESMPV